MSKPSEKAMQLAVEATEKWGGVFSTSLLHQQEIAKLIDAHTAAELEAQHRKTWALAMDKSAEYVAECLAAIGFPLRTDSIRELPCPPIEETKDK